VVLTEPDVEVRTVTAATFGAPHDDQTFGVIALCGGDDRTFDDAARIVTNAARLAGIAVEHAGVQDRLAHQAEHDPVTDLPNRVVFLNRLIHALPVAERMRAYVLVLFLDLDRFKEVNDSFGHSAGDDLLRQVAQRLRHAVRPGDIVARFGGDEFTMLCDGITDELHAVEVAERIQTVLTRPFTVDDREIYVTTSIGLALDRGSHRRPETVVENADAAMYRAKDRGGNCYEIFDEAMRARAVRRLATQTALHGAIARREFHVFYQTTVSLGTGDVVGVEALVRWTRPGTGLLMPADFIPLAEETGLIVPIGAHVMEEAFRQATRWGVGGRTPTTSVNLSARQLAHPRLLPMVEAAIERSGADPATISLEITESALMEDVEASALVLQELKDLGLQIFVDDFGTGYSSLSYLQRFPVDGLKVDRSFVAGVHRDDEGAAIVRAVVTLAHSLGLVAIAEGVETEQQLEALRDLDCEIGQGYLFSRPVPPEQVDLAAIR
jgi:diguanylate cyclase (GGDEF)-like protein